jgi:hypothetical protein
MEALKEKAGSVLQDHVNALAAAGIELPPPRRYHDIAAVEPDSYISVLPVTVTLPQQALHNNVRLFARRGTAAKPS